MDILDPILPLFALALIAGIIDAVAGGGGLITVPALLWAGLPPVAALATSKAQGVFGTFAAAASFVRRGAIDLHRVRLAVICTFAGAAVGTLAVQQVASTALARLIPLLLIGFALYFLLSPRVSDVDSHRRIREPAFALLAGTGIGFYDGFFGPGTGSFFALAYVALLGYGLRRATAHAKLLNFTSNLAAFVLFAAGGQVVWAIGLVMGAGQLLGGWIGAHLVLRHGARLVRPALVVISLAVSLKLLLDR